MTPDEYCRQKTAHAGSSFYYSFLFLPEARRRAITALYAFCREVDDVVDDCADSGVARATLDWWRAEVSRIYDGSPQHPVGRALQPVVHDYGIAAEYLHEIIDGMQMDLDYDGYPTFAELSLYCHRVAGVVGLLSAEIFGYEDRHTPRYAEALGIAFQLTNILRDVREDARRGRIYLPRDEMQRFGVSPADLDRPLTTAAARALFAAQAERARDWYRRAHTALPEQDRYAQRGGLIMSAIYEALLDEIEADGFRVLERRIHLTPLRKLWLAWRTARREAQRYQERMKGRASDR